MNKNKAQVNKNVKDLFTSDHETPLPQDNIETPKRRVLVTNEIENKTDEIYNLHKYVQSLATEEETMKLFMKKEFYLLKKSISGINSNTDATNNSINETADLLCKHEFLLQENASKNPIIQILAENQQHASNTKEVDSSESFETVKGT